MVKRLVIGSGIDSIPTDTIPNDPTEFVNWFKGVGIARWLAPADVRNVLQGSGIEISGGSFTTPPTIAISADFQGLLGQPYVLLGAPVAEALTDYRSLAAQASVLTLTDAGPTAALTIGVATNGIGNTQLRQGAAFSVVGNPTAAIANVEDLSQAQLTALINVATSSLSGAMPVLSGVATQFFNGAGAFSTPSGGASGANPSASIGLAVVNGTASTFMRSDGAPPLSQSISPTMTGNWTYTPAAGVAITVNGKAGAASVGIISANTATAVIADLFVWRPAGTANAFSEGASFTLLESTAQVGSSLQASGGQIELWQITGAGPTSRQIWKVTSAGGFVFSGAVGFNGSSAPAQVTGWGTPTGPAVVANFSGTAATTLQITNAIAKIITDLKAAGIYTT